MTGPIGIAVPFAFDLTGYPAPVSGIDAVNASIFTILSTYVGERVHRPTFGSYLRKFVFDPNSQATFFRIVTEIHRAVAVWEPRATITDIEITTNTSAVSTAFVNIKWVANGSLVGITTLPLTTNSSG